MFRTSEILHPLIFISTYRVDPLKSTAFFLQSHKTLPCAKVALQFFMKKKLNRFSVTLPPPNPASSLTHRNAGGKNAVVLIHAFLFYFRVGHCSTKLPHHLPLLLDLPVLKASHRGCLLKSSSEFYSLAQSTCHELQGIF